MVWPIDFLMEHAAKRRNVNTLPLKDEVSSERTASEVDKDEWIAKLKKETDDWYSRRPF